MTIDEWAAEIHRLAVEKGWWETERNVGEMLALVHSEVSEALEEWRRDGIKPTWLDEKGKPQGFFSELADVVIRIMDLFPTYGQSLEVEIEVKHKYNKHRSYRHGGKLA